MANLVRCHKKAEQFYGAMRILTKTQHIVFNEYSVVICAIDEIELLTEEGEDGGAVEDGSKTVLALHEQLAEFARIGTVRSGDHVHSVRVRGGHLARQVTVYDVAKIKQRKFR